MSAYKDVGGEKAYIGDISHGFGNLILCSTYNSPEEVYKKIKGAELPFKNIEIDMISLTYSYHESAHPEYGAKIEGIPVEDIFALPDWKE